MNNFQSLLLSKRLRTVIDKLPIIPPVHLETEAEWRRAYTVLTFLAHGYIWGGDKPSEASEPFLTPCTKTGLTMQTETATLNHLPSFTGFRAPGTPASGYLCRPMLVELQAYLSLRCACSREPFHFTYFYRLAGRTMVLPSERGNGSKRGSQHTHHAKSHPSSKRPRCRDRH